MLILYFNIKQPSKVMDLSQFSGFLVFLTIFTMGFWLMIFLITFIIPYWIGGALIERFKEMKAEKKAKRANQ